VIQNIALGLERFVWFFADVNGHDRRWHEEEKSDRYQGCECKPTLPITSLQELGCLQQVND
jgi:hypothetical protein